MARIAVLGTVVPLGDWDDPGGVGGGGNGAGTGTYTTRTRYETDDVPTPTNTGYTAPKPTRTPADPYYETPGDITPKERELIGYGGTIITKTAPAPTTTPTGLPDGFTPMTPYVPPILIDGMPSTPPPSSDGDDAAPTGGTSTGGTSTGDTGGTGGTGGGSTPPVYTSPLDPTGETLSGRLLELLAASFKPQSVLASTPAGFAYMPTDEAVPAEGKSNKAIWLLLIIVAAAGGFWYYKKHHKKAAAA
jgi:hypothetical protein